MNTKNQAAVDLATMRWKNVKKRQRKEWSKVMHDAKAKKKVNTPVDSRIK